MYYGGKGSPSCVEGEERHAHNDILQQFYLYGDVGLLLMAGLYGSFFRYSRRVGEERLETFFVTLIIFMLILGLADTEVYDLSLPIWAIIMFSVLLRARSEHLPPWGQVGP